MSMEAPSRPIRIVVADDDNFVRSALVDFLDMLGHEVFPVENGREAIKTLDRHGDTFDLLITDICMPGIDGFGLIRHVREQEHDLPILVITGYADNLDLEEVARMGIPIFSKPVSFAELTRHLPRFISDATAETD